MYTISHQLYLEISERLISAIGSREFYSGSVSCVCGDVDCKLTCTLIVSHTTNDDTEQKATKISKIVPIWWEFHTVIGSQEIINDFSLSELCNIALN